MQTKNNVCQECSRTQERNDILTKVSHQENVKIALLSPIWRQNTENLAIFLAWLSLQSLAAKHNRCKFWAMENFWKSAGETCLSGVTGASNFSDTFQIVFSDPFPHFSNHFLIDFRLFGGNFVLSRAALTNFRASTRLLFSPYFQSAFQKSGCAREAAKVKVSCTTDVCPCFPAFSALSGTTALPQAAFCTRRSSSLSMQAL